VGIAIWPSIGVHPPNPSKCTASTANEDGVLLRCPFLDAATFRFRSPPNLPIFRERRRWSAGRRCCSRSRRSAEIGSRAESNRLSRESSVCRLSSFSVALRSSLSMEFVSENESFRARAPLGNGSNTDSVFMVWASTRWSRRSELCRVSNGDILEIQEPASSTWAATVAALAAAANVDGNALATDLEAQCAGTLTLSGCRRSVRGRAEGIDCAR